MWAKLKQLVWEWRGVFIAAPSMTGIVILLRLAGLLQSMEWAVFDLYMRWRPLEAPDRRIAIVAIDEADMKTIGQGYIPDGVYAELLEKLNQRQPRLIGLDVYRDLPFEPGHDRLVEVFESTDNIIGIEKVIGDRDREAVSAPPALKAKNRVGANDLNIDEDNRVRRALLSVKKENEETFYSLSVHLALTYLYQQGISPKIVERTDNWWQLGETIFVPFEGHDGSYVRADDGGYQVLLNYRGPARHFETVSMTDILQDRVPPEWGRDRIILIGAVGESFQDLFSTPYTKTPSERMAGVEIHANITSLIISAALDNRPLLKSWYEPIEWLWILLWSSIGATLAWQLRYAGGVSDFSLKKAASPIIAASVLFGSTYAAFLWGWWIPFIPPLLGLADSAFAITFYIARTAVKIRQTFGRYLTDEVVANLLESPEGLELGGKRQKITILTSDLRGFTALSERLSPEDVVKILNLYLAEMLDVISEHKGTIDKFMGDGILVLFGAPTAKEDDAERAVACAIAMQLAMASVNTNMKELDLPELGMGIGINTGECVVGNIGSEKHTEYTVIGSQMNLTFRIETYTTGSQILISESTLNEVGAELLRIDGSKQVKPKGVKEDIVIYDIGGIKGKYNLFISKEEEKYFPLDPEIPLQYTILEGKHISEQMLTGRLVNLSAKGALIHVNGALETLPSPLTNIKLNLLSNAVEVSEDVYAKVLESPAEKGQFYVHFTAKPPKVAAQLDTLYKLLSNVENTQRQQTNIRLVKEYQNPPIG